jgi:hypothetical protein
MKIKHLVVYLLLTGISNAFAAASIAKLPVSMVQNYADGTSTTLSCKNTNSLDVAPKCTFTVTEGKNKKSFSILTDIPDYLIEFHLAPWRYRYFGELQKNHFSFQMDVECTEKDLKIIDKKLNPRCTLDFKEIDGKLSAREVAITYFDGNEYRTKMRTIIYKD